MAQPSKKQLSEVGAKIVQAYGHPIRARALLILGNRVASPKEIAEEIDEPIGKVSYHIRDLRDAGLIELVETDGSAGGVQHFYRASRLAIITTEGAEVQSEVERASSSAVVINLLVSDIATAVAGGSFDTRPERALIRHHARVDQRGWAALSDLYEETMYRMFDIHRESLARLEETEEEGIPTAMHLLLFEMPANEETMMPPPIEWSYGDRKAGLPGGGGGKERREDDRGSE